ncbi:hypothetical protein HPB49_015148 [Dermacentor silvarum]|uniref:Uncharacterized protein n=1 Tax=Dermacentor silvarum TaxID=543639 RepID=A0ACB8CFU0_DERSI|nr:hypothetical protein HPB49_015148 [Dermacentor silvarum]
MMKEMIHKLTATIAELKNDRSVRAATPATDNTANADPPSPLEPVDAANDDGESSPKKRTVVREHPALKPKLDDIKSVLSSTKTSLRFLGESMTSSPPRSPQLRRSRNACLRPVHPLTWLSCTRRKAGPTPKCFKMARPNDEMRIWQWNCRSFARKKASLQQYLRSHEAKPHVVLLQETVVPTTTFSGYQWLPGPSGGRGTATLVANKITWLVHDLDMPEIEHVMVELLPGNASRQSVYILNLYSSPSHHKQRFKRLFQKAIRLAASNPIVIAGDFNATHRTWGTYQNT